MELYKEILAKVLEKEEIKILFPNLKVSAAEIVEMTCYKALRKIKAIIEDDDLTDFEFTEEIICVLESIGSGNNRHDFG